MSHLKKFRVWEVILRVKPEEEDVLAGKLFDAGSYGIWSEDHGNHLTLHAYFKNALPPSRIEDITGVKPLKAGPFTLELKEETFQPVCVEDAVIISSDQNVHSIGKIPVILKSTMAFGTGRHASTTLAIKALRELGEMGLLRGRFLDIGTGTGILSIYALKKGEVACFAIDNDPLACEVARVNAEANGLKDSLKIACAEPPSVKGRFDVVVANITSEAHEKLFSHYRRVCRGYLVLSGIYESASRIKHLFEKHGFEVMKILGEDEWWSITGKTKPGFSGR